MPSFFYRGDFMLKTTLEQHIENFEREKRRAILRKRLETCENEEERTQILTDIANLEADQARAYETR